MNNFRSYGPIVLAALLVVVGYVILVPVSATARTGAPPAVPEQIAVPPGSVLLFSSHAKGVQMYDCQNKQWSFRAPKAMLFEPQFKQPTAFHYGGIDRGLTPGPWWESLHDSSSIRAGNALSAPSPNANSIPLLRLEVLERRGTGVFTEASYIQRLNTVGGVGPTGECTPGAQRRVAYTADYYFYAGPSS